MDPYILLAHTVADKARTKILSEGSKRDPNMRRLLCSSLTYDAINRILSNLVEHEVDEDDYVEEPYERHKEDFPAAQPSAFQEHCNSGTPKRPRISRQPEVRGELGNVGSTPNILWPGDNAQLVDDDIPDVEVTCLAKLAIERQTRDASTTISESEMPTENDQNEQDDASPALLFSTTEITGVMEGKGGEEEDQSSRYSYAWRQKGQLPGKHKESEVPTTLEFEIDQSILTVATEATCDAEPEVSGIIDINRLSNSCASDLLRKYSQAPAKTKRSTSDWHWSCLLQYAVALARIKWSSREKGIR